MSNTNNQLLQAFDLAPFSKINNADFLPAFTVLIEQTKNEINTITSNTEVPSFKNTIEALGKNLK